MVGIQKFCQLTVTRIHEKFIRLRHASQIINFMYLIGIIKTFTLETYCKIKIKFVTRSIVVI